MEDVGDEYVVPAPGQFAGHRLRTVRRPKASTYKLLTRLVGHHTQRS
ncbi:hypothetical protein ACIOJ9_16375 [Streptomyces sp. NPDC088175]